MSIQSKRLTWIMCSVGLILMLPLIAMQFTSEVNWSVFDFLFAGILLSSTGLVVELILSNVSKPNLRIELAIAVIILLLLVWTELAVGIFGTPFAGS